MSGIKGKIQTVLGPISPSEAGVVLAHEHLSVNAEGLMVKGPPRYGQDLCNKPLSPDIGWWLSQHPYSNFDNAHMYEDTEAVIKEMEVFKSNGGGTVVDNTTIGIQRDIKFLKHIAEKTGVHVLAGTGYYVESSRPGTVTLTTERMADVMRAELLEGCEGTGIKAGVIGEIGCSWPLAESEKRCVQSSAILESSLGCPVIIHPGRNSEAPFDIVRIYLEAGGSADRLVMSHIERTIFDVDRLLEFAQFGCYIDFDLFGIETSHYQLWDAVDFPSDAQRIKHIRALVDGGFGEQVTLGHDIHTKHRLMKYGGHGFSHILLNIVPKMLQRGISKSAVHKMLHDNPQKWLTFDK